MLEGRRSRCATSYAIPSSGSRASAIRTAVQSVWPRTAMSGHPSRTTAISRLPATSAV